MIVPSLIHLFGKVVASIIYRFKAELTEPERAGVNSEATVPSEMSRHKRTRTV